MARPSNEVFIASWRLYLVAGTLTLVLMAFIGRLAFLQLLTSEEAREQARAIHEAMRKLPEHRGAILDRNGHPLALSVATAWVSVEWGALARSGREEEVLAELSRHLGLSVEQLRALPRTQAGEQQWTAVPGRVRYEVGRELAARRLPGVDVQWGEMRAYPEGSLAAELLGFLGRDPVGLSGIEAAFQRELAGVAATLRFERDPAGNPIPVGRQRLLPEEESADLVLTLDRYLQQRAEQLLEEAVTRQRARGGTIIAMEPQTGHILALANRPTIDLTKLDLSRGAQIAEELLYRNRALTDVYEPGSVFKVITVAAALDAGIITPATTYVDNGPLRRYGGVIDNWDYRHHGVQNITQLLQTSNNVGAATVGDWLGAERFYEYVFRFGFGQPTGVGLPGEAVGQVRTPGDPTWRPIDLLVNTFGQGISVTPLQLATALNAVVNGGLLMRPMVVKEVRSDSEVRRWEPVVVNRVLDERTSAQMRQMLHAATLEGGGRNAAVPGYNVGGKTGTADVPVAGTYRSGRVIASFGGFAPVEEPRLTVLVIIDDPKTQTLGSQVAAPVFRAFVRDALIYLGVPPSAPDELAPPRPKR